MTQDNFKPDPTKGIEASATYAENYAISHRGRPTFDYRCGYICSVLIDALLTDYILLEVGCGTGGYFRLLRNYKKIIGLDFSKAMIDQGRELANELGLKRIEFVHEKFENYDAPELIDAINLAGVIGWYVPWVGNEHLLYKARVMLRPCGLAVFSFVKPRNWPQSIKAILFPRHTILMHEAPFLRKVEKAGLKVLFLVDAAPNTFVFCISPEPAQLRPSQHPGQKA
jgi:SAM-dependent methyltransferase